MSTGLVECLNEGGLVEDNSDPCCEFVDRLDEDDLLEEVDEEVRAKTVRASNTAVAILV